MAADERKHRRLGQPRNRPPGDMPRLQRCRDCRAYMLYGPDICSYCLSEHLEWSLDDETEEDRSLGPTEPGLPR